MGVLTDLSRYHHPLTSTFATQENPDSYRLSPKQIRFYEENGYLSGLRVLTDTQVHVLAAELDQLLEPTHPGVSLLYEYNLNEASEPDRVLFHALGAWRVLPGFHDLLWNLKVLVSAAQLLKGPVRFWHDQIFYKPASHGGVVSWHQDYSYWTRTRPMAHLSCWIALDDATADNGCLHYVPRSHSWNLLPITGLANNMNAIKSVLTEQQLSEFLPTPIELKSGEASFHHPLMVHGSFENKTTLPRRAVVLNFCRDGVESASNEPLLAGVVPIPVREKLDGQFFPLLYDPVDV